MMLRASPILMITEPRANCCSVALLDQPLDRSSLIEQMDKKDDDPNAAASPEPNVFRGPPLEEGTAAAKENEEDEEKVGEDDDEESDPDWNRIVCYSQLYNSSSSAVRCGLEALSNSDPPVLPPHGANSPSGTCAVVNETGMVWKDLPSSKKFVFDYEKFPDQSTKTVYLWRHLGRGNTGQAFLACNSSGRACVAKFYLLDEPTLHRKTNAE
eukprot:scaffold188611_cov57-Attheya_sp.AAC.2